ncbi:4-hydroxy-3-methylbut-2-enyl diphosphate reductase [Nocardia sp. SYP-A9097]|uniref:4-hydroxy-3-methylbut-2-enyl diphosphate reductase n=1 Tax=Nocardia sp. SYP-A9097 TaxID=2663237 RepID=UPI00129AC879|nr:4-hydroxy-3-methylbut-2-enyl diphosphate reductase [Nocardia sp. SYP-A9097]MRH88594.1 4-hydroxy-3-methylbut-2-enyl diphosphate reductase [Nocardia sp. SYP-A9097]
MPDSTAPKRTVLLAEPRGFCAGVRRAIAIADQALQRYGPPVYVRKEIVHNHRVVADLRSRGAIFVDSEEEVPEGALCIFSAHGVAPAVRDNAARRGLDVIDATCPLVAKVHQEARRFARDGRTLLLVGHASHEEVEGTFGEAPDSTVIVETRQDAQELDIDIAAPTAILTQTTLSLDETEEITAVLRERFPNLAAPPTSDICYASENRQQAVKILADRAELVLVVGSTNSSNSVRMVEVAATRGARAHLVPDVGHFQAHWLDGITTVGVSAGASAPEELVDELLAALTEHGFANIEILRAAAENIEFGLPARLTAPAEESV